MEDPNSLNYEFVKDIGRHCFSGAGNRTLLDWGCASGRWVNIFREQGFEASGFDLTVPEDRNLFQADIKTFIPAPGRFDYATCSSVLLCFSLKEIEDILTRMYASFNKAAFIFTPNSSMQSYYVPSHWGGHNIEPVSFPSEVWLRQVCEHIGGTPVILNFREQIGEQNGPSILWLKDYANPVGYAASVARRYREAGYRGFTISI